MSKSTTSCSLLQDLIGWCDFNYFDLVVSLDNRLFLPLKPADSVAVGQGEPLFTYEDDVKWHMSAPRMFACARG